MVIEIVFSSLLESLSGNNRLDFIAFLKRYRKIISIKNSTVILTVIIHAIGYNIEIQNDNRKQTEAIAR